MLAVIETGSKQYTVKKGDELVVEKLDVEEGAEIRLDRVLLVEDGKKVLVGKPVVKKAKVTARLVAHQKGPKLIIFKYKRRKKYRRKIGHRQKYSRLRIEKIEMV